MAELWRVADSRAAASVFTSYMPPPTGETCAWKGDLDTCPIEVRLSSQPRLFKGGEERLTHRALTVPWSPQPRCTGPIMQGTRQRSVADAKPGSHARTLLGSE